MKKYQLIASGTFDLLHKGHETFLKKSLECSDEVIVCITSDSYVRSFKNLKGIESFGVRKNAVVQFLTSIGAIGKTKIIPIDDIFGPLLTNQFDPQVIAVTPENKRNALRINNERVKSGLPELEIKVIPMDLAADGKEISSTRIRNGEINRQGRLYVKDEWRRNRLLLPKTLRPDLQKPLGKVLDSVPLSVEAEKTITIGDITTQKFNEAGVGQFLSIIDFQVKREKKFDKLSDLGFEDGIETIRVDDPPASISPDLFKAIQKAFGSENRKIILINGEEDLAVLPVLLIAHLGCSVFYGQPDKGMVEVEVSLESKERAHELVSKFTS